MQAAKNVFPPAVMISAHSDSRDDATNKLRHQLLKACLVARGELFSDKGDQFVVMIGHNITDVLEMLAIARDYDQQSIVYIAHTAQVLYTDNRPPRTIDLAS